MIRFQWYLELDFFQDLARACLGKIPIIGDWLADEVVKSLEMKKNASDKEVSQSIKTICSNFLDRYNGSNQIVDQNLFQAAPKYWRFLRRNTFNCIFVSE